MYRTGWRIVTSSINSGGSHEAYWQQARLKFHVPKEKRLTAAYQVPEGHEFDGKPSTHEIHGERGGSVCELRCNIQTAKQASPVQTTPRPPIRASVMTSRR